MRIPLWAQDLVIRVAIDEGRDDLPELTWHRRRKTRLSHRLRDFVNRNPERKLRYERSLKYDLQNSTGRTFIRYYGGATRVHVTQGTSRKDAKLVLLHELAHWLSPNREHHGPSFWDKAWELYRRYRVPIMYAKEREGNYHKGAIAAYRRSR